jgi:hypothetical protein
MHWTALRVPMAARLVKAFSEPAEEEKDPERKSRLRQLVGFLGETGKDLKSPHLSSRDPL